MKTNFNTMLLALVLFAAGCTQQTEKEAPVDLTASKTNVAAVMDGFHSSLTQKNAVAMTGFLAEDGIYSGTDPKELFDKKQYSEYMTKVLGDPSLNVSNHKVESREVRVDESGTSATVIEQFKMDTFTPNIPWRLVSHLTKQGDSWKINLLSFNLTPTNAQLGAIVKAVK